MTHEEHWMTMSKFMLRGHNWVKFWLHFPLFSYTHYYREVTCTHRANWYVTCSWPFHESPVIYGANNVLTSMCFIVVIVFKLFFCEYQNRNSWRLLGHFFSRKWRMHVEIWSHITIFGRQCDYFRRYVQRWLRHDLKTQGHKFLAYMYLFTYLFNNYFGNDLWLTQDNLIVTFDPPMHFTLVSGSSDLWCPQIILGKLTSVWPQMTPEWPFPHHYIMLWSGVLPTKFGSHRAFLSNLTFGGPQMTPAWPLTPAMCDTLVKGTFFQPNFEVIWHS